MANEFTEYMTTLYNTRETRSDEEILAELQALEPLPDEDDPNWDSSTWNQVALFLAVSGQAAMRKLEPAIPLILEKSCYGDPGETMRGLCHTLEGIVKPDWFRLTPLCIAAAQFPQRGARLWAINELGRVRDPAALDIIVAALRDPADKVRHEACFALVGLCRENKQCCQPALAALQQFLADNKDRADQSEGQEALHDILELSSDQR